MDRVGESEGDRGGGCWCQTGERTETDVIGWTGERGLDGVLHCWRKANNLAWLRDVLVTPAGLFIIRQPLYAAVTGAWPLHAWPPRHPVVVVRFP